MEDYKQEGAQRQLERQANRRLYDEEATVDSGVAYPPAAVMAPPIAAPADLDLPNSSPPEASEDDAPPPYH